MPDWSYRTIFRPLLFRVHERIANRIALGTIGGIARWPGGGMLIDLLGHMRPDGRLQRVWLGAKFASPIGFGPLVDPNRLAPAALACFGIGFLEIGPLSADAMPFGNQLRRRDSDSAIEIPETAPNPGLRVLVAEFERTGPPPVPLIVHLAGDAEFCTGVVSLLTPFAALFAIDRTACDDPLAVAKSVRAANRPIALSVHADEPDCDEVIDQFDTLGAAGIVIDGSIRAGSARWIGKPACEHAVSLIRQLRERRSQIPILAGGGVHEPADALDLIDAGADLVRIDSGFVFGGPGLPKRCNEALLARLPLPEEPPRRTVESSWFWAVLLGAAMLGGGLLALAIAATRVVLPYDESFCGISREQFQAINSRLLSFMAHDRVSLAGAMLAIGVSYIALGWGAIRRGRHWAWLTVMTSALAGFASFFLFIGFGYFDPFHAFVTASLFALMLQVWSGRVGPPHPVVPDLREDLAWRRSLWGQLLAVGHGAGVLGAGLVISTIGATSVFVEEDLQFMGTTADALRIANPRLIPLVAHDRASFGGMLISSGIVLLLSALWGWRRGEKWLWWMYLLGFGPAYAAAIGVHLAVGYTDFKHLTPAMSGGLLLFLSLGLGRSYLCDAGEQSLRHSAIGPQPISS